VVDQRFYQSGEVVGSNVGGCRSALTPSLPTLADVFGIGYHAAVDGGVTVGTTVAASPASRRFAGSPAATAPRS